MYSERKWIKHGVTPESGWQGTGRTMTNGNGQVLVEIGKVESAKSAKKKMSESETPESDE